MRVAITGSRRITEADRRVVRERIRDLLKGDERVEEIRFGGAIGVDTEALLAAAADWRERECRRVVYLPYDVEDQPSGARWVISKYAHIIRKHCGVGEREPYRARNEAMVLGRKVLNEKPVDLVIGFWNGNPRSGTLMTMNIARKHGILVEEIRLERG